MGEEFYAAIFSENLKRLIEEHEKTQADIVKDLGFSQSTVSDWINGKKIPRMTKLDALCNYFGVRRSSLLEEEPDELSDFRQRIIEENHAILKALEKATPEERKTIEKIIKSIVSDD